MTSAVSACVFFIWLCPAWAQVLSPVHRQHKCQDMFLRQRGGFEHEVICVVDGHQKYSASIFPKTYYNFLCGSTKDIITEYVHATLGSAGSLEQYFLFNGCSLMTYADTMKSLGVTSVRELRIRNVKSDIPLTRKHLEGLEELNVERLTIYDIKDIAEDAFGAVPSIVQLNLSGNKGLRLPDGIFRSLTKLKNLRLSNIGLNNLPKGTFALPELEQLYLSRNNLNLTHSTFEGANNLQLLDLSSNSFTNLPHDVFKPLTNLINVDLSFNPLSALSLDLFTHNRNLSKLVIENVDVNIIETILKTFKDSNCKFVENEHKTFVKQCNDG